MKWIVVILILAVWIHYATGHDTKPVPCRYHTVINLLYAVMTVAAVMWL